MWELVRKRQQYHQVRKPKVADCAMDKCCLDGGGSEVQTMLSTPVVTVHSLRERFKLSPSSFRQASQQATSLKVEPDTKLDLNKINGEVCLLTDSPYRILRVSNYNRQFFFPQFNLSHVTNGYNRHAL
jgi:hypothetical protein